MEKYIIDGRYGQLLLANGIDPSTVLKAAGLAIDTFTHQTIKLTESDYFKLVRTIKALTTDPLLPVKLAGTAGIETFSPSLLPITVKMANTSCIACPTIKN